MRTTLFTLTGALLAHQVAAHATFQDLWVNGVDQGSTCVRLPLSNSPVTDVTSDNIRCNVGTTPVAKKCAVVAGENVAVEMHQQPGDRSCSTDAIGGDHYGPVNVYLSKVADSSTADGSSGWFKIYEDGWSKVSGSMDGGSDNWGTKDLNRCCGKLTVPIPADLAPGDYLLRAEVIALHVAGQLDGAQFYMSCYQLTISGSGTTTPATVLFPGAYKATDAGILVNIHADMTSYTVPGPAVIAGGTTVVAGSAVCPVAGSGVAAAPQSTSPATTLKTSTKALVAATTATYYPPTTAAQAAPSATVASTGSCSVAKYGQCGGNGWSGCTSCTSGMTCKAIGSYYSQCQ